MPKVIKQRVCNVEHCSLKVQDYMKLVFAWKSTNWLDHPRSAEERALHSIDMMYARLTDEQKAEVSTLNTKSKVSVPAE